MVALDTLDSLLNTKVQPAAACIKEAFIPRSSMFESDFQDGLQQTARWLGCQRRRAIESLNLQTYDVSLSC